MAKQKMTTRELVLSRLERLETKHYEGKRVKDTPMFYAFVNAVVRSE